MNKDTLEKELNKLVNCVESTDLEQDCYCNLVRQLILGTYSVN